VIAYFPRGERSVSVGIEGIDDDQPTAGTVFVFRLAAEHGPVEAARMLCELAAEVERLPTRCSRAQPAANGPESLRDPQVRVAPSVKGDRHS
jgi:hypothetical protein